MSHLGGRGLAVVVRAVKERYRCVDEFINIDAVQAIDPNCIELATQVGILPRTRRSGLRISCKIHGGRCRTGNQRGPLP